MIWRLSKQKENSASLKLQHTEGREYLMAVCHIYTLEKQTGTAEREREREREKIYILLL